jgi:hypothetical protein
MATTTKIYANLLLRFMVDEKPQGSMTLIKTLSLRTKGAMRRFRYFSDSGSGVRRGGTGAVVLPFSALRESGYSLIDKVRAFL